jgi:GPH family glycoside/pentoside/hexuronide:cation symporter
VPLAPGPPVPVSGAAAAPMPREGLGGWALFAAMLAAAGLPIYIHAPKFYVDSYGVGLGALGLVLFGLRLLDLVQDPALGWLSARLAARRGRAVALAAGLMAVSMLGLFAVPPPLPPLAWFALTLAGLFSGFSFLGITFYAEGVARAGRLPGAGHVRLAGWREGGALAGVCLAAVAPAALAGSGAPFALFAAGFAVLALAAVLAMRREWGAAPAAAAPAAIPFRAVLADPVARRLLLVALLNAAPVAVTSTLFLFFVEQRLEAPGAEGPLLLLFFLAAALSVPLWARAAARRGARRVLLAGMALSVLAFGFAAALGPGDLWPFALVCLASGAALGADMTLLPAIFAARLARAFPGAAAAQAFGLWSFVSKLALALAAVTLLPLLQGLGLGAPGTSPAAALAWLGALYALLPCALKLAAIAALALIPAAEA